MDYTSKLRHLESDATIRPEQLESKYRWDSIKHNRLLLGRTGSDIMVVCHMKGPSRHRGRELMYRRNEDTAVYANGAESPKEAILRRFFCSCCCDILQMVAHSVYTHL
jgi:hypothetical protein